MKEKKQIYNNIANLNRLSSDGKIITVFFFKLNF